MREIDGIQTIDNLPEYYHDIPEIYALCVSLTEEFQSIARENRFDLDQMFVLAADENSQKIWENEIYIQYNKLTETLAFRRKRIINRYTTKPPFTVKWLENQLRALLGADFLRCERDDDVEMLYVYADINSFALLKEFITTIEMTLPLSMLYGLVLTAVRKPPGTLYCGATALMHVHCVCG